MTTNEPNVKRYDDMGTGQICPINNMHESDDGDYVLYKDYEALKVECEGLVEALEKIENLDSTAYHSLDSAKSIARYTLATYYSQRDDV